METSEVKPSDLAKDDEVGYWEHQIEMAEKKLAEKSGDMHSVSFRDHEHNIMGSGWQSLLDFYRGNQWGIGKGGSGKSYDRITANLAKSNIDSIRPQLYFQNPKISISLKNPQLAESDYPVIGPDGQPEIDPETGQPKIGISKGTPVAKVGGQLVDAQQQVDLMEAIDNYTFGETKAQEKIRRIINDALILPYGVAKWEWVIEVEERETLDAGGEPTGEKQSTITRQYAKLSRVKPWQFIWDPELDEFDQDKANWFAEIKYLSEEDLKADKNLKGTDNLPEPTYYIGGEKPSTASIRDTTPEGTARFKLYEIHDIKHGELLCWIEGSDVINRKDSPSPYGMVEGSVYTILGFSDVPDDSFPMSGIDQIRSKAEAYNKIISLAVNHVGRFNRKYVATEGYASEAEEEKWERGEDGVTVKVKDKSLAPEPVKDAPVQTDAYNVASILKREITEDYGVTAMNRGTRETGVDTAFEASLVQGGADIKIQEKRDIVRIFCNNLVRKLNQILKAYADMATVIKVVGLAGERWVSWTNEDIMGEFLENVDIYSTLPFSEEVEKRQAMELFSLAQQDPYFDPLVVRQQVVRAFKWPENSLKDQQRLMQEQMQQQQMEQDQMMQQAAEAQKQAGRNTPPQAQNPQRIARSGNNFKAASSGPARNFQ